MFARWKATAGPMVPARAVRSAAARPKQKAQMKYCTLSPTEMPFSQWATAKNRLGSTIQIQGER